MSDTTARPWYREVTARQWKTFLTTFAAWPRDAFDFTILTFVLVDIQDSVSVNRAFAGALGTVTLLFRTVGIGAGTAADRYGRKGPILFSIGWYTVFAFLSELSTTYVMLFAFRGLFGIGMGGMWAAGMPLALERWPAKHRGIASGTLQGGYLMGFLVIGSLAFGALSERWGGRCGSATVWRWAWRPPALPVLVVGHWPAGRRLAHRLHGVGVGWLDFLDTQTDGDISRVIAYKNLNGEPFESCLGDILAHLPIHGQHHRGQINADLRAAGLAPPAIDFIHAARSGVLSSARTRRGRGGGGCPRTPTSGPPPSALGAPCGGPAGSRRRAT